jgi:hypothetical protein
MPVKTWSCLLLIALAASACATGGRSRPLTEDGRTGLAMKTVASKVDPAYLVAMDRTTCTVSGERYRQVRVGQRVLCDWKAGAVFANPRAPAVPGMAVPATAADRAGQRDRVPGAGANPTVPPQRRGAVRPPG